MLNRAHASLMEKVEKRLITLRSNSFSTKTRGYERHCKTNKIMWLFLQRVSDLWSQRPLWMLEAYAHRRLCKDLNRDILQITKQRIYTSSGNPLSYKWSDPGAAEYPLCLRWSNSALGFCLQPLSKSGCRAGWTLSVTLCSHGLWENNVVSLPLEIQKPRLVLRPYFQDSPRMQLMFSS